MPEILIAAGCILAIVALHYATLLFNVLPGAAWFFGAIFISCFFITGTYATASWRMFRDRRTGGRERIVALAWTALYLLIGNVSLGMAVYVIVKELYAPYLR